MSKTETSSFLPGIVSQTPWHDGDGYSWGGDICITFPARNSWDGALSLNLGSGSGNHRERKQLAHMLAASFALYEALEAILFEDSDKSEQDCIADRVRARAALSRARGEA